MQIETDVDREVVEEMGYAIVERANGIKDNGDDELAMKLRTVGREFIEYSHMADFEGNLFDVRGDE